jgi:hypothetical protein
MNYWLRLTSRSSGRGFPLTALFGNPFAPLYQLVIWQVLNQ